MNYSVDLTTANPQHVADGLIDVTVTFPSTGEVRYTASREDSTAPHSEELYARALAGEFGPIAPAPEPPPSAPDYLAFWDALMVSTVYGSIREQSFVSLPMNTLATEFIALIGDAKAGRANEAAIQSSMAAILATGTFAEAELLELSEALKQGNLNSLYALS
jgi:hypothetical protein